MGGFGSGRGSRWSTKTTTNEVKRLDVRLMHKQGWLKMGARGDLNWSRGGEPNGSISYYYNDDTLRLSYRYRKRGGEWKPIEQEVPIDHTACHYGGERPWFRCPSCSRRVALIYMADSLFLCRHCYKLPYESQQQGWRDRLITQKHKLGERVFEHYEYGEGYGKKKGMHWKTYERLHKRYQAKESAYLSEMGRFLQVLRGVVDNE